ncbi:MAG: CDP-glycerol glycerophosphotransferase family protein [Lachnospiraceae bacterium]|nr:CDP-glycerol glycerophosphotransferase family protein [Lachnospiraceae bacterium]
MKINERIYVWYRIICAKLFSCLYYCFRIIPIRKNQIVFSNFEGKQGYGDNPKAIAEKIFEMYGTRKYKMIWLVNDNKKCFPDYIKIVKNGILRRAYYLSTSRIWIDNHRKKLEVRKRKGQLYIATWHGMIGFKKVGALRGEELPKIAELVSRHDSELADIFLSNSLWCEKTIKKAFFYNGEILRTGSPRCDICINIENEKRRKLLESYGLDYNCRYIMYAPTFRGYKQNIHMNMNEHEGEIEYENLCAALKERFGGEWKILYRSHPGIAKEDILSKNASDVVDVSGYDDMYSIMACCDAFISDYSSCVFDASAMKIPVFLLVDDYDEYAEKRGILWDLDKLPFPYAKNNNELIEKIIKFDDKKYMQELNELFKGVELLEDGRGSERVVNYIDEWSVR